MTAPVIDPITDLPSEVEGEPWDDEDE